MGNAFCDGLRGGRGSGLLGLGFRRGRGRRELRRIRDGWGSVNYVGLGRVGERRGGEGRDGTYAS